MKLATVIDKSVLYIAMIFYAASKLGYYFSHNDVIMLTCSILVGALVFLVKKGKLNLRLGVFHLLTSAYLLYCSLSFFWAEDGNLTFDIVNMTLKALIALYPFYIYYRTRSINDMLKAIMLGGYLVCIVVLLKQGIQVYLSSISKGVRVVGKNALDANNRGIIAAISLVINLYFLIYDKKIYAWTILAIPALICLSGSASRASLVALFVGGMFLLVMKNYSAKRKLRSIFRIFIILVCFCIAIYFLMQLPFFSALTRRVEIMLDFFRGEEKNDVSMSERSQMLSAGIDMIKRSPIWGVGINNSSIYNIRYTYLHNNFLEVFAGGGILGFVLYYSMYAYILIELYKNRKFRTKESDICFVLVLMTLAVDMVHVSMYNVDTFFCILIYFIQIENMKRMNRLYRLCHLGYIKGQKIQNLPESGELTPAEESAGIDLANG